MSERGLLTLPQNPAGLTELSEAELAEVNGGALHVCISIIISISMLCVEHCQAER